MLPTSQYPATTPAARSSSWRSRLLGEADSEHEQAGIRLLIGAVVFVYVAGTAAREIWLGHAPRLHLLAAVAFFLLFCACMWIVVAQKRWRERVSRLVAMATDNFSITIFMLASGGAGAPLYGLYLWITIGNGFRFGRRYLYECQAMALAGFALVIAGSAFWRANLALSLGLWVTLVIVPGYTATLLQRMTEARRRAELANQAKSVFVANMSHEIRTPLNGIIGAQQLLAPSPMSGEQKELVEIIGASSKVLLSLVDNVLDIAKIEAGKVLIERAEFDLYALVNSTAKIFKAQANEKRQRYYTHIAPDLDYRLIGDAHHLRQVLLNLLGNAVKFTGESGTVSLSVRALSATQDQAMVRFEVTDTGIGIPKEVQARIFDSFTQADDSTTRRYGGTGLGTTIAKQLVELMGGRIGVDSELGHGTTFWFELPFTRTVSQAQARPQGIEDLSTLLVGLGTQDAQVAMDYLSSWGCRFGTASDSHYALQTLATNATRKHPYRIVVVEAKTPSLDALRFAADVLAIDPGIGLILLNPALQEVSAAQLFKAGYACLLSTPIEKLLFFNALHSVTAGVVVETQTNIASAYLREARKKTGVRVLLAEDNPTNRKIIKTMLTNNGHSVETVEDGEKALDILERERFDLIIVDMHMPGRNGVETALAYQYMFPPEQLAPIIMLTANATHEARAAAEQAGVKAFLTKPIEAATLISAVDTLLGGGAAQTRAAAPIFMTSREAGERLLSGEEEIDEAKLADLKSLGGGNEFLRSLIEGFLSDGEDLLAQLRAAVEHGRHEQFKDIAHALKGSSASLGALKLTKLCASAERMTHNELGARSTALAGEIEAQFALTRTALQTYYSQSSRSVQS